MWLRASSTQRSDPFLTRCSVRVRPLKTTRQAAGRWFSMDSHISLVTMRTVEGDKRVGCGCGVRRGDVFAVKVPSWADRVGYNT